jgi:hypothetical protein
MDEKTIESAPESRKGPQLAPSARPRKAPTGREPPEDPKTDILRGTNYTHGAPWDFEEE